LNKKKNVSAGFPRYSLLARLTAKTKLRVLSLVDRIETAVLSQYLWFLFPQMVKKRKYSYSE